ncbi:hypothetical protein LYNGBM3L_34140 [Moorena producens 3L]|nr:hypothetical protein LYNGBM3L_34140 [Moorena producens 3L]
MSAKEMIVVFKTSLITISSFGLTVISTEQSTKALAILDMFPTLKSALREYSCAYLHN